MLMKHIANNLKLLNNRLVRSVLTFYHLSIDPTENFVPAYVQEYEHQLQLEEEMQDIER